MTPASRAALRLDQNDVKARRGKLANAYRNMLARCRPDDKSHHRYFDRGIHVCAEWKADAQAFYSHIGLPPALGRNWQVDRIDNDRGYEPGNVRWATCKQNVRNSSLVRRATIGGVTKSRPDWCEEYGMQCGTLKWRTDNGWAIEEAVRTPVGGELNPMAAIAIRNGIEKQTYYTRVRMGWAPDVAATQRAQANWLTLNGVTKRLFEWARDIGITKSSLKWRLKSMPLEVALTLPKQKYGGDYRAPYYAHSRSAGQAAP